MPQSSTRVVELPIDISAKTITRGLMIIILCLALPGALSAYFWVSNFPFPISKWFHDLFSLDQELNIPAWYSSFLLLFSSGLLALITYIKKADRYYISWRNLSIIFLWLSLDEAFSFHEILIIPSLREVLNLSPIFFQTWVIVGIPLVIFFAFKYFKFLQHLPKKTQHLFLLAAWVIVGIPLVIFFAVKYFKFLLHLPKKTQHLFLLAATVYLSGTLGMEMLGGILREYFGRLGIITAIGILIEELLEMTGIVIFIYALLAYLSSFHERIHLKINISEK